MTRAMGSVKRLDEEGAGAERRAAPRVLVDLEVDYRAEDTFLFAYIADISATGIFIRTTEPEPAGTHLNLRFHPPEADEPVELEGEVIWVNRYRPGVRDALHPGMGVRFLGLDDATKARLYELVRRIAYLA
jgi:uncharacterized protein (TIGR02266 family)